MEPSYCQRGPCNKIYIIFFLWHLLLNWKKMVNVDKNNFGLMFTLTLQSIHFLIMLSNNCKHSLIDGTWLSSSSHLHFKVLHQFPLHCQYLQYLLLSWLSWLNFCDFPSLMMSLVISPKMIHNAPYFIVESKVTT